MSKKWNDWFRGQKNGYLIVATFIIVLVTWGSCAKADGMIELGPSQVGSSMSAGAMLTMTERVQDKYDFTLGYITKQKFEACDRPDCVWYIDEQIFFGVEYMVTSPWTDKLRVGLGPYWFQKPDRVGTSNFRVGLNIEYRFNDRFGLRVRHFSNAGSGKNITICRDPATWRNVDESKPPIANPVCQTNDWNTGQDSWLRAIWYF